METIFGILRYRRRGGADGTIDMWQAPADRWGVGARSEPHTDRDAECTLVGDVRLDDRDALRGALGVSGPVGAALSDRALILRAWMRWGKECPNHLLGDYAFAVWDARTRSIFCARDHIGCRPFYYALTSDRFIFASTIEAVMSGSTIEMRFVAPWVSPVRSGPPSATAPSSFGPG